MFKLDRTPYRPRHIGPGQPIPAKARWGLGLSAAGLGCAVIHAVVVSRAFDPVHPPSLVTPWALLGMVLVLAGVVLLLAQDGEDREQVRLAALLDEAAQCAEADEGEVAA